MDDNKELLEEFVAECRDNLTQLNDDFLAMDAAGEKSDDNVINNAFRLLHNIKGSSGFFELKEIETLSHAMENLLNRIREKTLSLNSEIVDTLFESLDKLEKLIDAIGTEETYSVAEEIQHLQILQEDSDSPSKDQKKPALTSDKSTEPEAEPKVDTTTPFTEAFLKECQGQMEPLSDIVDQLEQDKSKVDELVTILKRLDASAQFLELDRIHALSKALLINCAILQDKKDASVIKMKPILKEGITVLTSLTSSIESLKTLDITDIVMQLREIVDQHDTEQAEEFNNFMGILKSEKEDAPKEDKPEVDDSKEDALEETEPPKESNDKDVQQKKKMTEPAAGLPKPKKTTHIRLNVKSIDRLVNLAGELLLTRNQVTDIVGKMGIKDIEIQYVFEQLNFISSGIQDHVMQLRLQPLATLFNKFPRLVRDLSKKSDKKIDLIINDNDVEIDKMILESLSEPLTHIIRNSVDHGIETLDEREKSEKDPTGKITLSAMTESGLIKIVIDDDGRGIDAEKIIQHAIDKSLLTAKEAETLSDNEKINYIYYPGFSTAAQVSEVSGRGVGMDVVKTNIEKLGGHLTLDSKVGQGTHLVIRAPLTLSIISALIVQSANHYFAIPQTVLKEIVEYKQTKLDEKIEHFQNIQVINVRDEVIPIIYLDELLGLKPPRKNILDDNAALNDSTALDDSDKTTEESNIEEEKRVYLLILKLGIETYCLIIDDVIDSQDLVIKKLSDHLKMCKCYSGASILGNGSVVLILDVPGIISEAKITFPEKAKHKTDKESLEEERLDKESLLIVKQKDQERFSLPLEEIVHMMVLTEDNITKMGQKIFFSYLDQSIPLIYLEQRLSLSDDVVVENRYVVVINTNQGLLAIAVSDIVEIIETNTRVTPDISEDTAVAGRRLVNKQTIFCLSPNELYSKPGSMRRQDEA